jgi:hypothetical protein
LLAPRHEPCGEHTEDDFLWRDSALMSAEKKKARKEGEIAKESNPRQKIMAVKIIVQKQSIEQKKTMT